MASFDERVYAIVRRVPRGRVITYGAVAGLLGDRRLARQVGWAMRRCPADVPAHRVINAGGGVSGGRHPGDEPLRQVLLKAEGVRFGVDGRCDLARYAWKPRTIGSP